MRLIRGQFLSQLQAIAEGVTVKVGVEMDEASRSKFLNSLKNIVPKTPVKVKVEPETAGRSSFAKQLSSVAEGSTLARRCRSVRPD